MLDTNNLGDLDQPSEEAETAQPKAPNPIDRLADRWRKKAVRYGSKDAGVLSDPTEIAAQERPSGDPFGPTAPAAAITGYSTGGRRSGKESVVEEDRFDPKTGLRIGKEAEAFPYYEPDDENIIWRFMFGRRP